MIILKPRQRLFLVQTLGLQRSTWAAKVGSGAPARSSSRAAVSAGGNWSHCRRWARFRPLSQPHSGHRWCSQALGTPGRRSVLSCTATPAKSARASSRRYCWPRYTKPLAGSLACRPDASYQCWARHSTATLTRECHLPGSVCWWWLWCYYWWLRWLYGWCSVGGLVA